MNTRQPVNIAAETAAYDRENLELDPLHRILTIATTLAQSGPTSDVRRNGRRILAALERHWADAGADPEPAHSALVEHIQQWWPMLINAAKVIAYDGGSINRDRTEEEFLQTLYVCLDSWHNTDAHPLNAIEEYLRRLSPNEFETVCCGDEDEARDIMARDGVDADAVEKFMVAVFEDVCPGPLDEAAEAAEAEMYLRMMQSPPEAVFDPGTPAQYRLRRGSAVVACSSGQDARDKWYGGKKDEGYIVECRAMLSDTQPAECWSICHV